jgi:hypothetical protein
VSGDNFHFDLTGVSLAKCLDIAFEGAPGGKAVGWAVMDGKAELKQNPQRLVLFWSMEEPAIALPAPMTAEDAEPFVRAWLKEQDYGPQPDHDGDNGKGWRVYNESWSMVAGKHRAFVAIEPCWIMYGK